jgi:hypothetical protein
MPSMSTTGRQSLGCIVVSPPLRSSEITPRTSSSHRISGVSCSVVRILLAHARNILVSTLDAFSISSFGTLDGPGALPGFR